MHNRALVYQAYREASIYTVFAGIHKEVLVTDYIN